MSNFYYVIKSKTTGMFLDLYQEWQQNINEACLEMEDKDLLMQKIGDDEELVKVKLDSRFNKFSPLVIPVE